MKFVLAVVMLALAVGVNSSLLTAQIAPAVSYVTQTLHPGPLLAHGGYPGLGLGHLGGPYDGHYGGHYGGPAAVSVLGLHGHGLYGGYPGISLSQGPAHGHGIVAPIAAPLPLAHGHSGPGVYVAKTRGAIHTAPLAGHINSATSLNVAPAPGTH